MVIKIADKELHLIFGMHLQELLVRDAMANKLKGGIAFTISVIAYAHENWCLAHDAEPLLTKGQIFQYVEANSNDMELAKELANVINQYSASKVAQQIKEGAEQTPKKKPQGLKK